MQKAEFISLQGNVAEDKMTHQELLNGLAAMKSQQLDSLFNMSIL
jgi:hypothetical protein